MAKMRIYELAKELGETNPELDSKTLNADILKYLQENGSEAKSASSGITDEEADLARNHFGNRGKAKPPVKESQKAGPEDDTRADETVKPDKEEKTGSPVREEKTEKSGKSEKPAPHSGKTAKGRLRGKDGRVIIYRVDDDGRLIDDETGNALPFLMGKDGVIYKQDGTPLARTGKTPAQPPKPAVQPPMEGYVFDGRSSKDRRNAAVNTNTGANAAYDQKRNQQNNKNQKNNVATGRKGSLTDALGDRLKAFESQLDPNNENYVPEKKEHKKKQDIELPKMPKREPEAEEKKPEEIETRVEPKIETKTAEQSASSANTVRPDKDRQPGRTNEGTASRDNRQGYGDRNRDRDRQGQGNRDYQSGSGDRFQDRRRDQRDGRDSRDGRDQRDGRDYRDGRDQNGNSRRFQGGSQRDQSRGFQDRNGSGKGFGDKDKDSDQRRNFGQNRRNDNRSSGGSAKAELMGDIGKNNRANNLKDRSRDKNRKDRNRDFDEENQKNSKKKDPNRKGAFQKPVVKPKQEEEEIKTITIPEVITIKELADKMKQNSAAIIKKLFMGGKMVNVNSEITFEEAEEIALDYEIICEKEEKVNIIEELLKEMEEDPDTLVTRPPVVCVMGHVDHGKTSLLDAIRNTNVTEREAGGITQHIGAYMVEIGGRKITFLDTPGHEAFTSMRMRGAKSTDIAILVVAADDGVMPQTVEAINHAKAANVSIIVAVNKIDKPGANIDRVKQELTEHGLIAEDWGGDTVFVPVSAKTGEGIENLLEMVLLTADVLELKANPDRRARGIVIEAQLDKGRGPVATVLIQKGTLNVGDNVAIGAAHGKVRAMIDDKGRKVKVATPSTPVEILGLNAVPQAGEVILAVADEKEARTIAEAFIAQSKEQLIAETKARLSLDGLFSQIQAGEVKELGIIVKADVMGSVEAVKQSLVKLSNEEVVVRVIHGGVGNINESDVTLASASNAIIIGFNVKPDNTAKDIAEHEGIDIKLYKVIYDAINDVESAMKGMLKPVYEEKIIGHAEVRQLFKASGIGVIAGSYVLDGKIVRGCMARVSRGGEQIFEGNLASLKRFKDDVKEVAAGYECGLVFEKFSDLAELDQAEFYIMEEVPRT
ncbi:MAG: translation initiation factor IF-2 [Lachnospiraceae bacterium]|nr:translation initiation factor IF-2 [Lachnospiraceae bacterium]